MHMGYIKWKTEIECPQVKGMIYYLADIFRLLVVAQISCIFCIKDTQIEGAAFGD